jgi:hypothetical protein
MSLLAIHAPHADSIHLMNYGNSGSAEIGNVVQQSPSSFPRLVVAIACPRTTPFTVLVVVVGTDILEVGEDKAMPDMSHCAPAFQSVPPLYPGETPCGGKTLTALFWCQAVICFGFCTHWMLSSVQQMSSLAERLELYSTKSVK